MSDPTERDEDGLNRSAPLTIKTWTGKHVDPLDMHPEDVDVHDIAHSLARQNRYNGHNEGYLSVARHSLWVAGHLLSQGYDDATVQWGLLHDAAETWLTDVPRPLKQNPAMAFYLEAEEHIEETIAGVFELTWPMPDEVKAADRFVLLDLELTAGGARDTYFGDYARDEVDFLLTFDRLQRARRLPRRVSL